MRRLNSGFRFRRGLLLGFTLLALGCDPIVMIPGGALSGETAAPPADWAFTDTVDTVQLETRPSDPYSVNVWAVAADGALFVAAGSGLETTWAGHIQADDRVRLRVESTLYDLRAEADSSDGAREAFLEAAKKKYDFDPDGEDTEKAILFRLLPR